ncbi:hypothetical protein QCA50_011642 [Cerrena zonata]|uniref:G domain-containing protein n=1 Tax=Cerrena zonata TaxID=2478898 RepID=A0AAW0G1Q1_9APHY
MIFTDTIHSVIGATGTGKSTFINLVSGAKFGVGNSLLSATQVVQSTQPFNLNGHSVVLIDTPGFDDSTRTDTDILRTISTYLANTYRENRKLTGIIYMHRISDPRMTGVSRRNFLMFRKLCGDATLSSVTLVTNMWGLVPEGVAVEREKELASNSLLFKPVLDGGARMVRHDNTLNSARRILEHYVGKGTVTLQIQDEVVTRGLQLEQTAAGAELEAEKRKELEEAKRKQEEEMRRAQEVLRAQQQAAEQRRQAEIAAARQLAEAEAERQRKAHEAEMLRQAEERRHQEHMRLVAQQQLEHQMHMEALERQRQQDEARRIQEEAQRQQAAAEAERARLHQLMLQARQQAEAEARRARHHNHGPCIIC